jgi:hypothetical protein
VTTASGRVAFEAIDADLPREQGLEVLDATAVRHLAQYVQEVTVRLVAVMLGRAQQAEVRTQCPRPRFGIGEEKVLACDDERFDLLFGQVIVDFEASIAQGKRLFQAVLPQGVPG